MVRFLFSKAVPAAVFVAVGAVAANMAPSLPSFLHRPIQPGEIEVYFSPKGGCTEAIVDEIARAKRSIFVQAYSFTSAPIAQALVAAHRRGVETTVLLDKSQQTEKYTEADFLEHSKVPTYIDSAHSIAHNKVMVIDGETVITGSFNFTKAAEFSNAENLLIVHQTPDLAEKYLSNWREHRRHSSAYSR